MSWLNHGIHGGCMAWLVRFGVLYVLFWISIKVGLFGESFVFVFTGYTTLYPITVEKVK